MQGDKIVLIVEDDLRFGKIIIEKAHEYDLKAVVASNYIEVFDFVNRFTPIAITLDVKLPDTSGWKVLDLLRNDLNYRHIPIHLISGEENRTLALKRGARSFLLKPLENEALGELFEDIISFKRERPGGYSSWKTTSSTPRQITKMLHGGNMDVTIATNGKSALQENDVKEFDCIILDYTLPISPASSWFGRSARTNGNSRR